MTAGVTPDPHHAQLRTWYDQLTARIEALDRDIGWALTQHDRTIHKERRDVLVADRELVTAYQVALERDEPPPGPWPPDFRTTDLLAAPPPRILYRSGRCDFYRHIPLPPNYITRPELLAEVRDRLLAGTGSLALTSAIQVKQADVLHGMGGIGKSVLARALCDDPDVQAAFPDGILWATLGQTPDLTARLREWIETLGGIVGQTAPTLDQLRNTLAEALRDKACLLIVDDAWRKAHLEPFCAGGPACRLLITTRDVALAEGLDARVYPVPVMAPDQAVALLEEWAQGELAEVEAEVKAKIVRRLGYLPLAVRLAGAQLRGKDPAEWLAAFDARKLKTRRVETVHDSLEATFAVSLDTLDPVDRRLYVALVVFKEDEATPIAAIAKLWGALDGRDASKADELLGGLEPRALVGRSGQGGAVTIHDLLRDFMASELGEEGRSAAHLGLLDAYRQTQEGGGWDTAPDDGYLYEHLAYHLGQVADSDSTAGAELHGLFADQAWMLQRVPQCKYQYDGYLEDLGIAWHASHVTVHQQIDAHAEPSVLAGCVRYALIRASINSLSLQYDPSLVACAVETGAWRIEQVLSLAMLTPNSQYRAALFTAALQTKALSPGQRKEAQQAALEAALSIEHDEDRIEALATLALQLTEIDGQLAIEQGMIAMRAIADEEQRTRAFAALGPRLRGKLLEDAVLRARALHRQENRAQALAALAPQLTGSLLEQSWLEVRSIRDERSLALALAAFAPQLTNPLLPEGLAMARTLNWEEHRAPALAAFLPRLTGTVRQQVLEEGLAAARSIPDAYQRAQHLTALASQMSADVRRQVLEEGLAAARSVVGEYDRAQALTALASQMGADARPEVLREGLAAARTIPNRHQRVRTLAAVAAQLTGTTRQQVLEEGLAAGRTAGDEYFERLALGRFRKQSTEAEPPHRRWDVGWSHYPTIEARAALEQELAERLGEQSLRAKLLAAQEILSVSAWARVLATSGPQLTGELIREQLAAARTMQWDYARAEVLVALAPQLTGELVREGLAAAKTIWWNENRAKVLVALAPQLTGELVREGLAVAKAIGYDPYRTQVLVALAPQLTGELVREGLADAKKIEDEAYRTQVLVALAPQLTGELVREGLAEAKKMKYQSDRAEVLSALAPQLTGELVREGLAAANLIRDEGYRALALMALAPQLTGEAREAALQAALAAAKKMKDQSDRAAILIALAPQLTGELVREGLAAAKAIRDEQCRVRALAALALQLTGKAQEAALRAALTAAQAIRDEWSRTYVLAALAPQLMGELVREGLAAAKTIENESCRAEVLVALAPQLTGERVREGLGAAQAIRDERSRVRADSCVAALGG